jgi:hypothetical protein
MQLGQFFHLVRFCKIIHTSSLLIGQLLTRKNVEAKNVNMPNPNVPISNVPTVKVPSTNMPTRQIVVGIRLRNVAPLKNCVLKTL